MAKRSNNNSAGRRTYGEKPYDANNSFVKKMATKVTDLIPQRSWISKWFNSPGGNGLAADQDNADEQDVEEESLQPPSKRPCIRLDVTHPTETFRIQSRNRITGNTTSNNANIINRIDYTANNINSNEQYEQDVDETMPDFPQPIAGSSRSFAASTPTLRLPGRLTHTKSDITPLVHQHQRQQEHQQQQMNIANGADDNSESSESTSGCSSLIPQTSRQDGLSNFIIYPFASKKGFTNDKLSFTNHLQSPRSLLFNGRDSLSSRRPSFNVSMVSNDNSPLERGTGLSSPFYSGNTTFGGANAIGNFRSARRPGQMNEFQLRVPKRSSVRVKPSNSSTTDTTGMSQTAKRILETLEHFSSPITDAKKIPVKAPMSTLASRKRAREEETISSNSFVSSVAPIGLRHLTRELTVPTVPDMLKLRRRQRLTNTTLAARKIISAHSEPAPQVKAAEYHLRADSDDKKFMGKLRTKAKKKVDLDEPAETVNLTHIPLPITTLPSFDIPIPESSKNNSNNVVNNINTSTNKSGTSTGVETKPISPLKETESFKFSSPIKFAGADTSLESDGQFTFSQPIKPSQESPASKTTATSMPTFKFTSSKTTANFNSTGDNSSQPSTNFMWSGSSTAPRPKEKKVVETKPDELQVAGSVMDILGKKTDKSEVKIWECRECFIKNNDSDDQCIACKARKSDSSKKMSLSSASTVSAAAVTTDSAAGGQTQTQFGTKFKLNDKWECNCCLVRNPMTETKCLSCMAPRQDNNASKLSTSTKTEVPKAEVKDKTKAAEGTWECPGCMLKNPSSVITCPCCHASKPGLVKTAVKNTESVLKVDQKVAKTWECPSCMVRNNLTASTCVCCTTPCPDKSLVKEDNKSSPVQSSLPVTSGFGDKFKKPAGAWTCDSCMVQNKSDVTECVACGGLKPGATADKSKKAENTPMPFSFGIPPGAQPQLGAKTDDKKSDSTTNGFTFAAPTSQAKPSFTFGIPSTEKSEPTGFKFSAPTTTIAEPKTAENNQTPASGFTFGVPKTVEKVADKVNEEDKPKPMFSFGAPKTVEKEKSIIFSNPLTVDSQVNSQDKAPEKSVTFSFVPPGSVASAGSDAGTTSSSTAAFTFSEPKVSTSTPETIKFGQTQSPLVSATTTSGFSFTRPKFTDSSAPPEKKAALTFGSGSGTAAPVFGLGSAAAPSAEEKSSPFEIADKSKTPFTLDKKPGFGIETKPAGFGEENKTPATFGSSSNTATSDKSMFNTGSTAPPAFGSAPTTSTPSLFGSTPASSIFGTGTTNFGTSSSATPSIFSAVKSTETPAPATNNQGLFSFGAASTPSTQNTTGGFNFTGTNNTPATQKPMFSFGSNAASPAPSVTPSSDTGFGTQNFGSSASSQPAAFSFNPPKADPPAFGQPSATPLPSIFNNQASGSLGQTPGSANMFNFGSAAPPTGSSTASGSSGFSFNTGLNTPATPASGGFNFNPANSSPAIAFDPNSRPSFNFTGGSAVAQFSATPQQAVTQRKIKRAVRRMHPRT
ncbi:nuclear pore complex protein Nup153 [Microplitis demolitor]|uniref:nuclear pore complex protein Nup153 n=1 Tax=Microplitis demolitor TaxID=69319 RepID=UPI0004CDBC79|nr:nuclear pore complex protein Nup153 [Microplitis demolitor]